LFQKTRDNRETGKKNLEHWFQVLKFKSYKDTEPTFLGQYHYELLILSKVSILAVFSAIDQEITEIEQELELN